MSLDEYRKKRDFAVTSEPQGAAGETAGPLRFVVQEHHATHLHWDFRLELAGVLKSWAVPKGPSLVVGVKRLAAQVEDHPLDYAGFEGVIPPGEYGGGRVLVWDQGTWAPQGDLPAGEQLARGDLKFLLFGHKLRGGFALVRFRKAGDNAWLLLKERDEHARPQGEIVREEPRSVLSGRAADELI